MNYELSTITLKMTPIEFEAVYQTLQEFREINNSGKFRGLPEDLQQQIDDRCDVLKNLKFVIQEESPTLGVCEKCGNELNDDYHIASGLNLFFCDDCWDERLR